MRLRIFLLIFAALLGSSARLPATAQAPPGWGWAKKIGGYSPISAAENDCAGVGRDAAGNLYVAGSFVGVASFDGSALALSMGENDIFLAKYDPAGTLLWLRTLQGGGKDYAHNLAVDAAGNTVVAGVYGSYTGDSLVLPGGQVLQGSKSYGAPNTNGIYGGFSFLAAFDAQGSLRWGRRLSPTYGINPSRIPSSYLHIGPQGEVYWSNRMEAPMLVGGQTYQVNSVPEAFLVKYSATGQLQWFRQAKAVGGTIGAGLLTDATGAVYWHVGSQSQRPILITGTGPDLQSTQGPVLVKFDAAGAAKWLRSGWPYQVTPGTYTYAPRLVGTDATGGLIVSIQTLTSGTISPPGSAAPITIPAGGMGTLLLRSDTSGTITWTKLLATTTTRQYLPLDVKHAFSSGSSLLVVGNAGRDLNYLWPSQQPIPTNVGGATVVLKYDPATETTAWVRLGGVPPSQSLLYSQISGAAADAADNVYVGGFFRGTAHFGATTLNEGTLYCYFAKLDQNVLTSTRTRQAEARWAVYPNPTAGQVRVTGLPPRTALQVLDGLGRCVRTLESAATADPLDLSGLAPGLYVLRPTNSSYAPLRVLVQP